jgi:Phage Mu protein F like protein
VRAALDAGMAEGRNPRATALDIAGRLNRATGRREGGILGLNSGQTDAVIRARAELLSGDPTQPRNYLTRARRDKRFDRLVMQAIRDGKPVAKADVDRITGRYKDRLLQLRGETIARTETLASLNAGKQEGIRQLIDSGKVPASAVKKRWRATGDDRTRDSHLALNDVEVGLDEVFVSPLTGAQMLHPHDTSRGAPASETIGCRCFMEIRIDYFAQFRGTGRNS